ncbi:hypothetical protein T459_05535 [Capsicum annuum]|uniref:Ubiquitin-like protease family profile domain-containing protein n=1 Tax=Capsicum annuum TaxID=4072 RepID=A0A2G3A854_CAPAN|nr:hypothetical protein FXO37_10792 [Capsicum annuum]PHT90422.1 hypothetical protein T459_05535 [Capsicum annuum]
MRMQCDGATDLTGDLMVKSVMEKSFDAFRKILREQKLDSYFRKSCFGKYLDLPKDNNAHFQMKMVYDLLKHRFMYENKDRIDEVWINYRVFETTSHYDYDHNGCTNFSPDFASSSECSSCKCQDCKAKYDGVINSINALTASVKEITSKRGVIPSKRISYPDTPLEIKTAKRRRKNTSKASSIIKKSKITMPLSLSCTDVQYARATEEQHELKKQPEVSQNEECLINIFKGFSIPAGLPWHLVNEIYIPINYDDEFHWVLAVIVLNERRIRVYDSMSQKRRFELSFEIQNLAKILLTYLDMSGFLDQKVCTDWSTIEVYRNKMDNPFDVQYIDGIAQQTIGSLDCRPFVAAYAEYLSNRLQVPNDGLDARLLRKIYAALLWTYREAKAQKPYATDVKDPR